MKMTVLVTGSSGTVGTALVKELDQRGYHTIPLDIRKSYWDQRLERRTVHHDLRKPLHRLKLRRRPDVIVHLAANARVHELVVHPRMALDNYVMVHNVLEFARQKGIPRVLFSSSREIYGESKPGGKRRESDTDITRIKSPYTASKFGAEGLIHAYRECYHIQPVIVRLSNVYGRYDVSERVIPLATYYALRDRDLTVFGKEKKLDFTFIDDCVDGLVRIVERFDRVAGETFNISRGRGERLLDLLTMIIDQLESRSKIRISNKRVGEISSFIGDISNANKKLGYKPSVDLADGIKRTIGWYLDAMKSRPIYDLQRRCLDRWGWL